MFETIDLQILYQRVLNLRSQVSETKYGSIPSSITFIESILSKNLSDEDRKLVYTVLVGECSFSNNDQLKLEISQRRAKELPDDPLAHIALAWINALVVPRNTEAAVRAGYMALEVARREGEWLRYCACDFLRIGLLLDDYDIVNGTLKILVEDACNKGRVDHKYEFDFVEQIDRNRCNSELLSAYLSLMYSQ
jgi:hypothetical protein